MSHRRMEARSWSTGGGAPLACITTHRVDQCDAIETGYSTRVEKRGLSTGAAFALDRSRDCLPKPSARVLSFCCIPLLPLVGVLT